MTDLMNPDLTPIARIEPILPNDKLNASAPRVLLQEELMAVAGGPVIQNENR